MSLPSVTIVGGTGLLGEFRTYSQEGLSELMHDA